MNETNPADTTRLNSLGNGEFLSKWMAAWREADEEFGVSPNLSPVRTSIAFLAFLRLTSRFGVFSFGPLTIHVATVEDAVARLVASTAGTEDGDGVKEMLDLVQREQQKSGRRHMDELNVLLAFMRLEWGIPQRVFGELGVSPEQVERYALTGETPGSGLPPEPMYTPEEAAAYLKVHVETVRDWIRSGRLRAGRLAGQRALRIRARDLQSVWEPLDVEQPE